MKSIPRPSTFSIAAHDPDSGDWGIAVASKFLSVGAVVPFARAEIGAVATQSYANTSFGPAGLELMAQGYSAQHALNGLLAADDGREHRQVGMVDSSGQAATFTGSQCYDWAGGRIGKYYAAQGNILAGPDVVDGMAHTFEHTDGQLVDRLLFALEAGQNAGGDSRGQQSAALLVVRRRGGYAGFNDRYVDLRVDDHPVPIVELRRLLDLHRLYMFGTEQDDILQIDAGLVAQLQHILLRSGHLHEPLSGVYDEETCSALRALSGAENLEGRWREGNEIDRVVLTYLIARYPTTK